MRPIRSLPRAVSRRESGLWDRRALRRSRPETAMGRALVLAVVALLVVGVLPVSAQQGVPRRDLAPGPAPQHDEQLSGQELVRPLAEAYKRPTLASALV